MKKFSELKNDEFVWVVYDKNWDKHQPSSYIYYPSEYVLEKCNIIKNDLNVAIQVDRGDRWEEDLVTILQNYLSINFHDIEYRRDYSELYNNKGQMSCNPSKYGEHGPWIEIFTEEENAKEYIKAICERDIKNLDEKIEDCNKRKELLFKSLENIK